MGNFEDWDYDANGNVVHHRLESDPFGRGRDGGRHALDRKVAHLALRDPLFEHGGDHLCA